MAFPIAIFSTLAQVVLGIGLNKNKAIETAVGVAIEAVSKDRTVPQVKPAQAESVANAVKYELPDLPIGTASQSLWPQILRYAISGVGIYLIGSGYVNREDWDALIPAAMAVGPVAYRCVQTWWARYKVLRAQRNLEISQGH